MILPNQGLKGRAEMYQRIGIGLVAVLALGLLLPLMSVTAASGRPDDGIVIWNEDYILAEGETVDGNVIVFNGNTTLETQSRVRGDVVVWNGNIDADGVIEGNLVASNGDIQLRRNAEAQGDVVCSWNCNIEREEGSSVGGTLVRGPSLRGFLPFAQLSQPRAMVSRPVEETRPFWLSTMEQLLRGIFRMARCLATILVIAVTAGLVALIWPDATSQMGQTAFESPGTSFGVGLLTVVAGVALIITLAVTICLSPAALLIAVALSAAGLLGWVAVGARVGRRLLRALNASEVTPTLSAGLGTLVISLVSAGLSRALCLSPLGWFLVLVLGCLGLGAVVLTRLGTRAYVPAHAREPIAPGPPLDGGEGPGELGVEEEGVEQPSEGENGG